MGAFFVPGNKVEKEILASSHSLSRKKSSKRFREVVLGSDFERLLLFPRGDKRGLRVERPVSVLKLFKYFTYMSYIQNCSYNILVLILIYNGSYLSLTEQ